MRVISMGLAAWLAAGAAWAEGERAGDFDYYVMALSWSANWCAATGDARDDPQCEAGRGIDFVLHGLSAGGDTLFALPLPARGHAGAAGG